MSHVIHLLDVFNFNDVPTNDFIPNCYRIFTILEPIDSLTNLLSHEIQKSQISYRHSPKMAQNHNNIIRNPNLDH